MKMYLMVNPSIGPGEHLLLIQVRAESCQLNQKTSIWGGGLSYKFHQLEVNLHLLLCGELLLLRILMEDKSQFTVVVKLLSNHLALYLNFTFSEAHARGLYQKSAERPRMTQAFEQRC